MFVADLQINNMTYKYDRDHDVLHLYFGMPTASYGDEPYAGIFVKYDDSNDSITGAIIIDFKKTDTNLINKHLPIKIEFSEIRKALALEH